MKCGECKRRKTIRNSPAFHIVRVETIDSGAAPRDPVRIHLDGRWRRITEILDRWYEGDIDPEKPYTLYCKALVEEEEIIIMRYLSHFHRWQVSRRPEWGAP